VSYDSVDQLQKILAKEVFSYAKDAKKAAGRALGTLVEIITFYLLKAWGFEHSIGIERALAEYGNPEITHNVEYSLHPILRKHQLSTSSKLPLTVPRIWASLIVNQIPISGFNQSSTTLLTKDNLLRNACVIAYSNQARLVATLDNRLDNDFFITLTEQYLKPYAMFECKRVGIEEGTKKGPQTIEKAKQGAYVAKSVSALHKIRTADGTLKGLVHKPDGSIVMPQLSEEKVE
jgi:hypothetical protein